MNTALRHFAERALIGSGVGSLASKRVRGRTLVLAYHNVVPNGEQASGDSSLHLRQRDFGRQLDALARSHDVIPIDDLLSESGSTRRGQVVITFDDAYAGALTAGLEELAKRAMPATIFVAPALLGCVTWWDTLAEPAGGSVPVGLRRHALDVLGGDTGAILHRASSVSPKSNTAVTLPRIATDSQLAEVASKAGVTLGSHSWSHPNLCALTEGMLEGELVRPLQWLRSRFAAVAPWLSYPYGLLNETVQQAAAKAGYLGAFRIDGGWMPRSPHSPYTIPRLNIPAGLSLDGFRLRLAGL